MNKGPLVPDDERRPATSRPQPAARRWAEAALAASAIACDVAAEVLREAGRDGLAVAAKAIAHLLRLVGMFVRHNDQR